MDGDETAAAAPAGHQVNAEADGQAADASAEGKPMPRGIAKLMKMRRAWREISYEERQRYESMAAAERQRFSEELEAWRQKQPDGGLGEAATAYLGRRAQSLDKSARLPRPRLPTDLPSAPRGGHNSMDAVLVGAALLKPATAPKVDKQPSLNSIDQGPQVSGHIQDEEDDDGWGDGGVSDNLVGLPSSAADSSMGFGFSGANWGSSGLPTPQSAPTAMGPALGPTASDNEPVDDLLADFMVPEISGGAPDPMDHLAQTHGFPQSFGPEEFAMARWEEPQSPVLWSDRPDTVGAPKVLGPQLCFNEAGKIVVNQSSLSQKMDREVPIDTDGPVQEVEEYKKAYRRTPATKWSDQESLEFYEALSLYGTDLFLVQTCFRNKSASQIKAKFTRELKRYPDKVEAALLGNRRKLTVETFERLHGKIDTSKHYKPPPTPEPGQEPEADGSLPGAGEEPQMPEEPEEPPEPEYTEEDESLTTNRLMALFD